MGTFVPFTQFVVKVHSRCDLACKGCYVYEHADQSWRQRPLVMSEEVAAQAARRICEHVRAHDLPAVSIILHGGEPLLAGPRGLASIAQVLRTGIGGNCSVDLRVHTNGVLLDEDFCGVFREHDIRVGISLDGDRASNDRHRVRSNGRSSYDAVVRAIGLVRREIPDLFAGLLCTIDVRNDPDAVYQELIRHRPPAIDFLLPHATWTSPPDRPTETAYADWLIRVFDSWLADGRPVPVRMFDSVIRTSHGASSLTESLGLEPTDLVVIEADGAIEQADSLKTAYAGAPATGYNVFDDSLDAAAAHPGIAARQQGAATLARACQECPVVSTCGGGLYAHRYRAGEGFANPSVYCADLLKLIQHVQARLGQSVHAITAASLDGLASGYGDETAIASLAGAQRSLRRALLASIPENAETTAAWSVIGEVDLRDREALDEVLAHPFVRAWAARCLRGAAEARYLAGIAAAAAIRAGHQARLPVPAWAGAVHLPTLGTWRIDKTTDIVQVTVHADGYELDAAGTYLPLRVLRAGDWRVTLDDLDPYRDCYGWPAASRLDDDDFGAWQRALDVAWELIEHDYPAYARGLAAGLRAIVPLVPPERDHNVSASARDAFGAVAIGLPAAPEQLALQLIHEYQHVKLGGVLDLLDLADPADTGLYYAPWRPDPRPLEGLLQGAYAHLAVADFWRVRHGHAHDPAESLAAAAAFARWRNEVLEVLGTLSESGSLTPIGQRFIGGMRRTLVGWLGLPVPDAAIEMAARDAQRHRSEWRQAHGTSSLRPD
jgi:uncharacterized protein